MNIPNSRIPLGTSLLDAEQRLTRPWILFLEELQNPIIDLLKSGLVGICLHAHGAISAGVYTQPASLLASQRFSRVRVVTRTAAGGSGLLIPIRANGTVWLTVSVPAGATVYDVPAANVTAAGPVEKDTPVWAEVTASSPGANDLAVYLW